MLRYFTPALFIIALAGCKETNVGAQGHNGFSPVPKTPVSVALHKEYADWKPRQASVMRGTPYGKDMFVDLGMGYLVLAFDAEQPIYSGAPTKNERRKLAEELLHHCQSQRGRDQLAWIAKWGTSMGAIKKANFVRVIVRYETAPQGTAGRKVFGYEARFKYEGGTCGARVALGDKVYKTNDYIHYFD